MPSGRCANSRLRRSKGIASSKPPLVISLTRSPSRSTRLRKLSCLISRNHSGPLEPYELKRPKHAPNIGIRRSFANLLPRIGAQNAIPRGIMRDNQGRWLLSGLLAVRPFFLGRVRIGVEGNHPWRASSNFPEWIWPNLKRK